IFATIEDYAVGSPDASIGNRIDAENRGPIILVGPTSANNPSSDRELLTRNPTNRPAWASPSAPAIDESYGSARLPKGTFEDIDEPAKEAVEGVPSTKGTLIG